MSLFWCWLKCYCVYCLANIFFFSVHLTSFLCKGYFSKMLSLLWTVIVNNCNLRKRTGCGVRMRTQLMLVQQPGWSFMGPQLLCSFAVITHFTQVAQMIEHSRNEFGGWKVSGSHGALLEVGGPLNAWPNFPPWLHVPCSSFSSWNRDCWHSVSSLAGSYPVFLPETIIYSNETFTKESTFWAWFLEGLGVIQWLGITWHFDFWMNIFSWHCREMRQCEGEPCRVLVELTGAKLWSLNWTRRIFHSSVGRLQQLKVSKGNKGRKM